MRLFPFIILGKKRKHFSLQGNIEIKLTIHWNVYYISMKSKTLEIKFAEDKISMPFKFKFIINIE